MGVGGQRHATAALLPGEKNPGTNCIGGWVGPRAGLDGCGKFRPPPGFDPRTAQPVASRYTDCAIPAPQLHFATINNHTTSEQKYTTQIKLTTLQL